ncbi:hypothetical protein GCM10007853_03340 [Algimonas ampicilliniresistens]|uniref:HTH tetR-type domain-containing protein n=1 Tax=Algimonas ampicilliniresistens TaxID=1298735 RepID=A0ABQ5V717_9PROT|nr:TetR/AcrR family transcriptional regulator [Algimonas ampicilliniresistens]GLQ22460.1 hypothetical protein GCM10007853_03340 [Algimonas ampicilliniresistens]
MTKTGSEKQTSRKRAEILARAVELFNADGYHDTRLEDIANEVGKSKTSISYHFRSKDALLEEALSISCAFNTHELDLASEAGTGLERILSLVRRRAETHAAALAGRTPPTPLLSDIEAVSQSSNPEILAKHDAQIERICAFIQSGIDDGSVDVQSPAAATFFLLNLLHWLPRWFASMPNAHHESAMDGLCDLLRNGIVLDPDRRISRTNLRQQLDHYPAIFDRSVRNQLKRDAFLRTGIRFLNRTGFRKLSLNDLAKELGVTRGAFYYYISDKDDLLERCFDRTCDTIENALDRARRDTQLDAITVIEQTLRTLFEGHITDLDPLIRLNLLSSVNSAKRKVIEARLKRLRASFSEIIAIAMLDGSARSIDLDALENLFMGTLFSASQWRLAATPLHQSWNPAVEPVAASAAYFEPLLTGYARKEG